MKYFYITYKIKSWPLHFDNNLTLTNSLFGTVEVTKSADLIGILTLDMVFHLMYAELHCRVVGLVTTK